jgi:LPS-assembly lipoprotein
MSSPDRRSVIAALGAALLASGCGFRPLYGEAGGALRGQVAVEATEGRLGYHYRQQLRRRFGDPERDASYVLATTLAFQQEGFAITPEDDVTRYDVRGAATWTLRRRSDGVELARGEAASTSAYSTTATPYATDVAERDAERRVAADLADRVFAQVAAQRLDAPQ